MLARIWLGNLLKNVASHWDKSWGSPKSSTFVFFMWSHMSSNNNTPHSSCLGGASHLFMYKKCGIRFGGASHFTLCCQAGSPFQNPAYENQKTQDKARPCQHSNLEQFDKCRVRDPKTPYIISYQDEWHAPLTDTGMGWGLANLKLTVTQGFST